MALDQSIVSSNIYSLFAIVKVKIHEINMFSFQVMRAVASWLTLFLQVIKLDA